MMNLNKFGRWFIVSMFAQSNGFEDHFLLYSTCKIDSITFKAGKGGNLMGH